MPLPKDKNLFFRAWLPTLLWLVVIAWESTPLGSAENTSHLLKLVLTPIFGPIPPAKLAYLNHVLRKMGHFTGYGMMSLVFFRSWWATLRLRRLPGSTLPSWRSMLSRWSERAAGLAMVCTAVVASLDEWHQTFLPGRTGVWRDIVLDSMAATFVQAVILVASDLRTGARRTAQGARQEHKEDVCLEP